MTVEATPAPGGARCARCRGIASASSPRTRSLAITSQVPTRSASNPSRENPAGVRCGLGTLRLLFQVCCLLDLTLPYLTVPCPTLQRSSFTPLRLAACPFTMAPPTSRASCRHQRPSSKCLTSRRCESWRPDSSQSRQTPPHTASTWRGAPTLASSVRGGRACKR